MKERSSRIISWILLVSFLNATSPLSLAAFVPDPFEPQRFGRGVPLNRSAVFEDLFSRAGEEGSADDWLARIDEELLPYSSLFGQDLSREEELARGFERWQRELFTREAQAALLDLLPGLLQRELSTESIDPRLWRHQFEALRAQALETLALGLGYEGGASALEEALGSQLDGILQRELTQLCLAGIVAERGGHPMSVDPTANMAVNLEQLIAGIEGDQSRLIAFLREDVSFDASDLSLPMVDSRDWIEGWKLAFEQSLSSQEAALSRFLARRLDWEESAHADYLSASGMWEEALYLLAACADTWQIDLKALFEEGLSAFEEEAFTLNQEHLASLGRLAESQTAFIEAEQEGLISLIEGFHSVRSYMEGLETSLRDLLFEAGLPSSLDLNRSGLLSLTLVGAPKTLSSAKQQLFSTLKESLLASFDELDHWGAELESLIEQRFNPVSGLDNPALVSSMLVSWTSRRSEGAQALLAYAQAVSQGLIVRGESMGDAGDSGYEEIRLWVSTPSLGLEHAEQVYAAALLEEERARALEGLFAQHLEGEGSLVFEERLAAASQLHERLKSLSLLYETSAREREALERRLAQAAAALKTDSDSFTPDTKDLVLRVDSLGRLRLLGKDRSIGSLDRFAENLEAWGTRMNGRVFDSNRLQVWALARGWVAHTLENEKPGSGFAIGESSWLRGTVGQTKVNGTVLASIIDDYRSVEREKKMKEAWDSLDETSRADIEFLLLLERSPHAGARSMNRQLMMVMEEYEFACVDAILSAAIENHANTAATSGTAGVALVLFGAINFWNPLGWICGGAAAVAVAVTGATVTQIDEWKEVRSQYASAWEDLSKRGLGRSALFTNSIVPLPTRVAQHEECKAALRRFDNPARALELLDKLYAQLDPDETAGNPSVSAEFEALRSELIALGGGPQALGVLDFLDKMTGQRIGELQDALRHLDELYLSQARDDAALGDVLLGAGTSWIQNGGEEEGVMEFLNAQLSLEGRISQDQESAHLAFMQSLASGSLLRSGRLMNPLASYLASSALAKAESVASLERSRANTQILCLSLARDHFVRSLSMAHDASQNALLIAEEELREAREAWDKSFNQALERGAAAWEQAWISQILRREDWLVRCQEAWQEGSSRAVMESLAISGIRDARVLDTLYIPRDTRSVEDLGREYAAIIQGAQKALSLNTLVAPSSTWVPNATLVEGFATAGASESSYAFSREFLSALSERSRHEIAQLRALSAVDAWEKLSKVFIDSLSQANENFDRSMDEVFIDDFKWQRSSGRYVKDYVVHSTLFSSHITETESVGVYVPFMLGDCGYAAIGRPVLGSPGCEDAAQASMDELLTLFKQVFGSEDEEGLLGEHIGKAPEYCNAEEEDEPPVRIEGSGELGRLLSVCMDVIQKEGEGWYKASTVFYDRPIWDDRNGFFSWFKAFSLRDVTDLAVSIAAGACTAGMGTVASLLAGSALNMLDNVLFSIGDIANGIDSGSVLFNLGRQTLLAFGTPAIGLGFSSLSSGLFGSVGGVLGGVARASMDAASIAAVATYNGAMAAVSWDGESLSWSSDTFKDVMTDGLGAQLAGSFVQSFCTMGFEGLTGSLQANAASLASLCGGLTTQGLLYATEGKMSFNILDMADLSGGKIHGGLLRIDFGEDGFSARVDGGGQSLSYTTLMQSYKGLEAWKLNHEFASKDIALFSPYASALRTLYTGDESLRKEFDNLMSGATRLEVDANGNYVAKSYRENEADPKQVILGKEGLKDRSRFALNLILAHEAMRNGLDDGVELQDLETSKALFSHIRTSADLAEAWGMDSLSDDQKKELGAYRRMLEGNYDDILDILASYDMSEDFWKIKVLKDAEGKVLSFSAIWDESTDFDLSELGLGVLSTASLTDERLATLVTQLGEKGVTLNGRAVTLDDLKAIRAVNNSLTAFEQTLSTGARDRFMADLQTLQGLGIISGNGKSYVDPSIAAVGAGTYASPHAPILGPLVETTSSGHRVNMLGLQPETGGGPYLLTSYNHWGADYRLRQDPEGRYFAMFGGSLSLEHNPRDGRGLSSTVRDSSGNTQLIAHNGAETVRAFMNLWGSTASNLSNKTLSGVPAGSLIGKYGPTGNTTGAHLHMEVRNSSMQNEDPTRYLRDAGYTITSAGPAVSVYSGYQIDAGHILANREAFIQSEAFAQKFFGQSAASLTQGVKEEMLMVMRANNLFTSPGFASLDAETVLPYLQEWFPRASAVEKDIMLEIARKNNPGGYEQWKKLPPYAQQYVLPW